MFKKIIKYIISELIFIMKRNSALSERVYRILLYHSVSADSSSCKISITIDAKDFRNQMKALKEKGYNVISLTEMSKKIMKNEPIIPKTIAITFDDGYDDFLNNAFPILKEYGFPHTLFVCPAVLDGKIDSRNIWFTSKILGWDELKKLKKESVNIGSHSYSHKKLPELETEELLKELIFSKKRLEENLNVEIETLSYPYGSFNAEVVEAARQAGYKCAVSGISGPVKNQSNLLALKRVEIMLENSSLREFQKKLCGCYDWLGLKRRIFG